MSAHSGIYLQSSPVLSYYPHPFVLSPYRGSLTTVWYLDYAHLLFWFFFFNLLTTALVLVFFFFRSSAKHRVPGSFSGNTGV